MPSSMDRIAREAAEQYGPAPTTPSEALAHTVLVYADSSGDWLAVQATGGVYEDHPQTGLTMDDLRALQAELVRLRAVTAAPHATRMTAHSQHSHRDHLAREARDIADTAARFAEDVDRGIRVGEHTQLAQRMQQFLIRAVTYDAVKETAELFTTELEQEQP